MTDEQAIAFTRTVARRSVQHLFTSIAIMLAILGFYQIEHADRGSTLIVITIGFGLVVYNAVRIAQARTAANATELARAYVQKQQRSHAVRGRIFLIAAPLLIVFTWVRELRAHEPRTMLAWAVLAVVLLVLIAGWIDWYRALPRIRGWSDS